MVPVVRVPVPVPVPVAVSVAVIVVVRVRCVRGRVVVVRWGMVVSVIVIMRVIMRV